MAIKGQPAAYDCLAKVEDGEPYFVLLGRDAEGGHQALLAWIIRRLEAIREGRKPLADLPQVEEAMDTLYRMDNWRRLSGRPPSSIINLPGPADQAWIKHVIENLTGKHRLADQRSDPGQDQGYRRRTEDDGA